MTELSALQSAIEAPHTEGEGEDLFVKLARLRNAAEAAGEGKAAEYQEERIRFEQQKRLAAIDAHFAARGRHVIQGEGGRQLLSAFHDGRGVQASMMKRD